MNTIRRASLFSMMLVTAVLGACAGSGKVPATDVPRTGTVNHVVFFKLKSADQAAELIADCNALAGACPGVLTTFCGPHLDMDRDMVDASYDVCFFTAYESTEAYQGYLDHPMHVELVNKWRPRWEWIRIHDVRDRSPSSDE